MEFFISGEDTSDSTSNKHTKEGRPSLVKTLHGRQTFKNSSLSSLGFHFFANKTWILLQWFCTKQVYCTKDECYKCVEDNPVFTAWTQRFSVLCVLNNLQRFCAIECRRKGLHHYRCINNAFTAPGDLIALFLRGLSDLIAVRKFVEKVTASSSNPRIHIPSRKRILKLQWTSSGFVVVITPCGSMKCIGQNFFTRYEESE